MKFTFDMIKTPIAKTLSSREREVYFILLCMINENRWKPVKLSLKSDLAVPYDLRYDYLVNTLKALVEKNIIEMLIEGSTVRRTYTIGLVKPEESNNTKPVTNEIKPDTSSIKPEAGYIKPDTGLIKPEAGKDQAPEVSAITTESLPKTLNTFKKENNKETLDTYRPAQEETRENGFNGHSLVEPDKEMQNQDLSFLDLEDVVASTTKLETEYTPKLIKTEPELDIQDVKQEKATSTDISNATAHVHYNNGVASYVAKVTILDTQSKEARSVRMFIPTHEMQMLDSKNLHNKIFDWKYSITGGKGHFVASQGKETIKDVAIVFKDNVSEEFITSKSL